MKEVPALMGLNTAYVERTNLTSEQYIKIMFSAAL
jgi:hypothetical protein